MADHDIDFDSMILDTDDIEEILKKQAAQVDEEEATEEIADGFEDEEQGQRRARRSTVLKRHDRNIYRRAFGETQLLDLTHEHMPFQDGDAYHFITGGDVDALSFLKIIVRQQPLDYLMFSTWCMAQEDIYQMRDWLEAGRIKKIDAYVGEIFPNSYRLEYQLLQEVLAPCNGRIAVFKNHSKTFAGYGPLFHFGIQTSANINTNPRTENACITIGEDIYQFYYDYYSGIKSFTD